MSATVTRSVFHLPDLGEGLTEAEIVRWLVTVGENVTIDQPVVEVETAKAVVEVPSPFTGTVATLHGDEKQALAVGAPLVSIDGSGAAEAAEADTYREEERAGSGSVLIGYGTPGGDRRGRRRRSKAGTSAAAANGSRHAAAETASRPTRRAPLVISPLVRSLARGHGIQIADVVGTGNGGLITRSDVQRAIDLAGSAPAAVGGTAAPGEKRIPLTGFRKAVAETLTRSRAEIPAATVWVDVDATALWELRQAARTAGGPGPGILAYLARFAVAGLRAYPVLNARVDVDREEIVQLDAINLGIAVQGARGLVVPAVMDAHRRTTAELDTEIRALTDRAREGRSSTGELTAGTFTLNNYGGFGVDGSAAIINHPQVAILGFGRIIDRPWVVDGELCVRKITQMSFVFDHRVCDGGTAAGFMRLVADAIENPAAAIERL